MRAKPSSLRLDFNIPKHGFAAGWSSPVARQAHNLKVVGSNPAPATIETDIPAASATGMSVFLFVLMARARDSTA